jgi:hypothetical protein
MDNRVYGATAPASADPEHEATRALTELRRVLAPSGRLLITVPYGAGEDHGWFRQYDRKAGRALQGMPGLGSQDARVYAYSAEGWQISDFESAGFAPLSRLPQRSNSRRGPSRRSARPTLSQLPSFRRRLTTQHDGYGR